MITLRLRPLPWLASLLPCFRSALMRRGGLWAMLSGLLLISMMLASAIALPAQAAASPHTAQKMLSPTKGGNPDEAPSLPAAIETEAEKPVGGSPVENDDSRPGPGLGGGRASHAYLLQQAAAATARDLKTARGHDYPRDPCLRLNPGHAPPRG